MNSEEDQLTVAEVCKLKKEQMLVVNPEYQRGAVWNKGQKKRLVDSVLRGYPLPLIYLHHVKHQAGGLVSERYEVIDGQQRINALFEYTEGAYKLFDPVQDSAEARFPDFIKKRPCPWGGQTFEELPDELRDKLLKTPLRIVRIETNDPNESRDLFVRLQAGLPLTSQEKRDSWPGEFTDFVLRLAGKPGIPRYPGMDFFNVLMKAQTVADRGKFRQLAAQISMSYFTRRRTGGFVDINASAIDDFYYENLSFDSDALESKRLIKIFEKIYWLLGDKKRPKVVGHEAIHLVLLVDTLMDDYASTWENKFASAFDNFRHELALSKKSDDDLVYWLAYGMHTRTNSDRAETIRKRHEFFAARMREFLDLRLRDSTRTFGALERELIYYRDKKRCAVCGDEVDWADVEIHHIDGHAKGGPTSLENGVTVHAEHHPKGKAAEEFAAEWKNKVPLAATVGPSPAPQEDDDDDL
jgi:hypothetical protein